MNTTTQQSNRVSVKPGDRIWPLYDVPMRVDHKGKSVGTPLYHRANPPVCLLLSSGGARCEPSIVHEVHEDGSVSVIWKRGDGSILYPRYRKYVCDSSIWTNEQVKEDFDRMLADTRRRLGELEKAAPSNPDMIRAYYSELNRLNSSLIGILYSNSNKVA